jgi:hypothetical protein
VFQGDIPDKRVFNVCDWLANSHLSLDDKSFEMALQKSDCLPFNKIFMRKKQLHIRRVEVPKSHIASVQKSVNHKFFKPKFGIV